MKRLFSLVVLIFLSMSVFAQDRYYEQRVSQFDSLPVHANSLVFLGDGLTNGCEWHEVFCNRHIKNRGITGDRSSWIVNRLDTIVGGRPKKIFLMVGINDLRHGVAPREIVSNISKLLKRFEKESPWTRIFVQSLLPTNPEGATPTDKELDLKSLIDETNRLLEAECAERRNILYIDVHSALADEEGLLDKRLTNDGLHLNGAGYMAWKVVIEKHVK